MDKLNYKIRSVQLLNYVNDIESGRLITNPFFQRNLVWREIHKQDFIKTILLGYPFPHIFLSKGKIDLEQKISIASIVDGQQRTNAITDYINGKLTVNNKKFIELSDEEKQNFYKYEIPVIELDLTNDDKIVSDIFKRINRTSNPLTMIDRKSSEFSASEFMHFAEFMSGQLSFIIENNEENEEENEESNEISNIRNNPYIQDNFKIWAKKTEKEKSHKEFLKLINNQNIFTIRDIARKVNLQYTLNIISTIIRGFFNRNDMSWELAEQYNESFNIKDEILKKLNDAAHIFNKLNFKKASIWNKKSNFFSLIIYFCNNIQSIDHSNQDTINKIKNALESHSLSDSYKTAAKEGVNNKKERELRNNELINILKSDHTTISSS